MKAEVINNLKSRIEKHYTSIDTVKPVLYIVKGIDYNELPTDGNKLFGTKQDLTINRMEERSSIVFAEIVESMQKKNNWYWANLEEINYLLPNLQTMFHTVLIKNNLYYNYYPAEQRIENIEEIYQLQEPDSDEEILNEKQETILNTFNKYYGYVDKNKLNASYYLVYKDMSIEPDEIIEYYDAANLPEIKIKDYQKTEENEYQFELAYDEDQILNFIYLVLNNKLKNRNVRIVITEDISKLPNNFASRLSILKALSDRELNIYFTPKEMGKKQIENSKEYHAVLKKYWGYDSFRDMKIYKDVQKDNSTINVSQEQIIDDIVEQSEVALKRETPRDIFVTASTGAGKSLMFQLPAMYLADKYTEEKPLTIVISPLIGLMNDQVESLKNNHITSSRTIHSNLSVYKKEEIIEEIQHGKVDILYISTETLQNRSDIKLLIGNRKIGLFIVDEAHIVTTWGKSFRADYWYMGLYLQKLRKEYSFPIVTFTATAIYGGPEDMYSDTIDSLKLANPISYFGYVKRDDIKMNIQSSELEYTQANNDYRKAKNLIATKRIEYFINQKQKTLIYFPTIKLINDLYNKLKRDNPSIFNQIARYYGPLDAVEKEAEYNSFKNNNKTIMFATKAFGMGIDIPDITNVMHFAPTGSVTDYIQEIGRASRGLEEGYAWFDFLNPDFTHVKRLHGMSAINNAQILEVMRKIRDLYQQKKSRNLTVNADDFQYLIQNNDEDKNIDNKIKIILLMIEKDFEKKMGYSPFYARPKQLFGNELIFVNDEKLDFFKKNKVLQYFNKVCDLKNSYYKAVYEVEMKKLWEDFYKDLSFPAFKYSIFNKEEQNKLKHAKIFEKFIFCTGIMYQSSEDDSQIRATFNRFMDSFEKFLRTELVKSSHFSIGQLAHHVQKDLKISDYYKSEGIAQTFVSTVLQYQKINKGRFITERPHGSETRYQVNTNYTSFFKSIQKPYYSLFNEKKNMSTLTKSETTLFRLRTIGKSKDPDFETEILLLGLIENMGSIVYEIKNGNNPQIYIRINSIDPIDRVLNNSSKYYNELLSEVYNKHKISLELLTYLFKLPKRGETEIEKQKNYSEDFWNIVEEYFLGRLPDPVKEKIYSKG